MEYLWSVYGVFMEYLWSIYEVFMEYQPKVNKNQNYSF